MVGGAAATVLSFLAGTASSLFMSDRQFLVLMVPSVISTLLVYKFLRVDFSSSTLSVVDAARRDDSTDSRQGISIIISTALVLVGGGSVGKEAAALQAGGSFASGVASALHLGPTSQRVLTASGMAGAFSALFVAPLAAVFFVLEVMRLPRMRLFDVRLLCIPLASATGWLFSRACGMRGLWENAQGFGNFSEGSGLFGFGFHAGVWPGSSPGGVPVPDLALAFPSACAVGMLCAFAGVLFVAALKLVATFSKVVIGHEALRPIIGALLACIVVLACGWSACGTGETLISSSLAGEALGFGDAFLKIVLSVICLGFGIKGGEIMPALSVGACVGAAWASMTGVPITFCSALGLIGVFSACSRCPLAALALGAEVFGIAGAPYFALVSVLGCLTSFSLNLYDGATWEFDIPESLRRRFPHPFS